jgi:hypothetical protein
MSATYYLLKDKKAKAPYFNIKARLDYNLWVKVMEEFDITWDKDTKHGQFYLKKDPDFYFKRQAYFDYEELEEAYQYSDDSQVIKTGKYSFFVVFDEERGISWLQFYNREHKIFLPLFFKISEKLDCYLIRGTKKIITKEYINSL